MFCIGCGCSEVETDCVSVCRRKEDDKRLRRAASASKTISKHRGRRLHFMFLFHGLVPIRVRLRDDVLYRKFTSDPSACPVSEAREYKRAKDRDRRVERSGADPRITRQLAARTAPHCDGRHWAHTGQVGMLSSLTRRGQCLRCYSLIFDRNQPAGWHVGRYPLHRTKTRLETGLDCSRRPAITRGHSQVAVLRQK